MIYIVSGFMRSGTGMMMECLRAGGLEPLHADELDENMELKNRRIFNALLNPHQVDEKLFKCMAGSLTQIAAWDWRIVFMRRPYADIKTSADALFGPGEHVPAENVFNNLIRYTTGQLCQRRDVQWEPIAYRDVLVDPLSVFDTLQAAGWPIDPEKAAAVVDPTRCHHAA